MDAMLSYFSELGMEINFRDPHLKREVEKLFDKAEISKVLPLPKLFGPLPGRVKEEPQYFKTVLGEYDSKIAKVKNELSGLTERLECLEAEKRRKVDELMTDRKNYSHECKAYLKLNHPSYGIEGKTEDELISAAHSFAFARLAQPLISGISLIEIQTPEKIREILEGTPLKELYLSVLEYNPLKFTIYKKTL